MSGHCHPGVPNVMSLTFGRRSHDQTAWVPILPPPRLKSHHAEWFNLAVPPYVHLCNGDNISASLLWFLQD